MLTEPAENPTCDEPPEPLDVVVLVVPENASPIAIVDVIARASGRDTAILVVLPRGFDEDARREIVAAGANHCAVAPSSAELFAHMQRARAEARHRRIDRRIDDDPLDALWRNRGARR